MVEQERRSAEDALHDGETASRLIVDRIPGIVLFMTPSGELEFVNQPVRAYFGKTLEQLKHWWTDDTVHGEDRTHAFEIFTRATASGEPYKFEARFRRHDGTYRWFQCRGVPHRDEAGHIVRWYAMGVDIDERKRTEEALRQSEARRATAERDLQLMIDTIPVFVAAYEPDGTRSFVNQTWQQYMGLTAAEATGPNARRTFPHFHSDDAARIDGAWRASLANGQPLLTEARVRRADGEYRWHTSHRVPLRNEQGEIIRWYSVGVDIDNQKSAEDGLRRSEARLAAAERELQLTIDTIPTLVATYRPDGSRIFVNQTWRDYLGLRPDDAVDAFRTTVVHPEDAARVLEEWQRCLTSELPFSAEMRLRRADGVYRWHTVHRVLARDESGAVVKWYSVGVDIDEQKRSEERLRRSEARLAAAERELQLTIDTIPTLVSTYRPDGSRLFVNQTWLDYTGLSPDNAINVERTDIVHPDDAARTAPEWKKSLATGVPFKAEVRLRRADGEYRWHSVHRLLARDETGAVAKWYSVGVDIEEQKRAEERLRESEYNSRLIADTIPGLIIIFTPDGNFEGVNRQTIEYFGKTLDDVASKRWSTRDAIHPEDYPRCTDLFKQSIASGEPFEFELRFRRSDGVYRWFQSRGLPLRDTGGRIVRWYNLLIDIDERKRAEEALQESQSLLLKVKRELELTIDTMPAMLGRLGADGKLDFVNQTYRSYTGLAMQEAIEGARRDFHPDDAERVASAWRTSLASGTPLQIDLRLRRGDGTYRWHALRRTPLRDETGAIVKWFGVASDIDERKRAEEKAIGAERELQGLLDNIPVSVATYAPDGNHLYVNKQSAAVTGFSAGDLQGDEWKKVFLPEEVESIEREWNACLASGEPFEREVRRRMRDGTYRWHLVRRVPVRDGAGKVIRWYGMGVDIEDRKRAEEALHKSEAELKEAQRELQLTIDSIPVLVATYRPDGTRIFVNQTWSSYTGLTSQEVTGEAKTSFPHFHPDDAGPIEHAIRASLASGEPLPYEVRLRGADGEYRWHSVRRVPLRDESGVIIRWYSTGFDIQDQKIAEEALRESEAQLKAAERELQLTVDSIPMMVATYKPDGRRSFVNKQWRNYANLTLPEAAGPGQQAPRHFHPDDSERAECAWRNALASGEPLTIDMRIRRTDGEYRWHTHQCVPLRDEQGTIVKWYAAEVDIEDKKRAESALLESEARLAGTERDLRIMLDSIPTITWRAGANGYVHYLNKKWFEYTGTTSEQVRGWRWKLCVHPDDLDQLVEAGDQYVTSGDPIDSEARLRRFDGEYRWFLFRPAPVRDEAGNVVAWYGTITDIEDRKQAEQKALEAEREVQRTIDNIPVLVGTYSAEGKRLSVNKWALEVTGLSAEDIPGERWNKAFHPDELEVVNAQWRECLAHGEPFEREVRTLMADGTYRAHLTRRVPLRDEAGKVIRWYGIAHDIEDQRRAEAELRRSETILAEGQRISSTGSFSWCLDTNELIFSEELCRIFEFDPTAPVTFEDVFSRIHPEDAPALSARMKLIRSGRPAGEQEVRLRMPDGRTKYLLSVGHMMQQPDNRAEYLGAIQDITERRVAEEGLDRVRSELAHVTRVMSLGALTASIAHEVNQPLAGIITNASTCLRMLAADPPNVDGARETARRTIRDGNRAADVITRLRALFGKKGTATETLDLNEATREVVALVFSDLLRNRVIVRVELADEPLLVTGDRVQLQQVILNLVRNASDAMGEVNDRPRNLLVKAERDQDGGARLTVTDAGAGLHPQTAERLFDAFYTSKADGMGIGLSVSRSIIESHGGKIWAEANDGPGATFSFSIPPQAANAEDEGAAGSILTRPTRGAHDQTRNA